MTIYSQHSSRGKVQILATRQTAAGLTSTIVTSVNDTATATPLVDALNRISACATIPMHAHDDRDGTFRRYPTEHLDALAEPETREALLRGAHSFWYEYVKVLMHEALDDLHHAAPDLPAPIRTALTTELHTKTTYLRAKPSKHDTAGTDSADHQWVWDYGHPAVLLGGGVDALTDHYREQLGRGRTALLETPAPPRHRGSPAPCRRTPPA